MLRRLEILVRQSADPPILNTEQDSVYRSILEPILEKTIVETIRHLAY